MTYLIKAQFNGQPYYVETDEGQTFDEAVSKIANGDIAGAPLDLIHLTGGRMESASMRAAERIAHLLRSGETVVEEALEFAGDQLKEDLVAEARAKRAAEDKYAA